MYWCNLLDCCFGKKVIDLLVKDCSCIIRDNRRGQSLPLHRWFLEEIRPVPEGSCPPDPPICCNNPQTIHVINESAT